MTVPIVSGVIEWSLDKEPGTETYRLRGVNSLRDRPIELTLTLEEVATLNVALERAVRENFADFADLDMTDAE